MKRKINEAIEQRRQERLVYVSEHFETKSDEQLARAVDILTEGDLDRTTLLHIVERVFGTYTEEHGFDTIAEGLEELDRQVDEREDSR